MRLLQSRIVIGGHEAGDRNDRRRGFTQLGVKLAGEGESVEAGQAEVGEDEGGPPFAAHLERLSSVMGGADRDAGLGEDAHEHLPCREVVFDHEDVSFVAHA